MSECTYKLKQLSLCHGPREHKAPVVSEALRVADKTLSLRSGGERFLCLTGSDKTTKLTADKKPFVQTELPGLAPPETRKELVPRLQRHKAAVPREEPGEDREQRVNQAPVGALEKGLGEPLEEGREGDRLEL